MIMVHAPFLRYVREQLFFTFYFSYHDIDLSLFSCAAGNVLLLKGVIKFEPDVSEFPEDKLLSLLEGVLEKCEKMKVDNACLQFLCHECEHDLLYLALSLTPFLQCEGRKYSDLQRQVRDVIPILPHSVEINMCFNR